MDKSINVAKELFLGIIFFSMNFLSAQSFPDLENPDINGINKKNPYAYGFLSEKKLNNSMVLSLNGIWKFKWSPDPQSRPVDFYTENYSTKKGNNILVPGNWELQGLGTPIYTNFINAFKRDFPKVTRQPEKHFTSFLQRNHSGKLGPKRGIVL